MRAIRLDGCPDSERVNRAIKELYALGFQRGEILHDHFLLINRYTGRAIVRNLLQQDPAGNWKQFIIHRPDIMLWRHHVVRCIIEIDGTIHDTRAGRRRTENRNRDYVDTGIPHIILNEADLQHTGQAWRAFLREELDKRGLLP